MYTTDIEILQKKKLMQLNREQNLKRKKKFCKSESLIKL